MGSGLVIRFDVVTLFPEMFAAITASGITSRALDAGLWSLTTWNPRDFTTDNYRTVDDRPYGGGPGHGDAGRAAGEGAGRGEERRRRQGGVPVAAGQEAGSPQGDGACSAEAR